MRRSRHIRRSRQSQSINESFGIQSQYGSLSAKFFAWQRADPAQLLGLPIRYPSVRSFKRATGPPLARLHQLPAEGALLTQGQRRL